MTAARIRVWDLPTRLFHWLLVGMIVFSWWSAQNHQMEWHRASGIGLLGLLIFRIVWGIIGGSTARFASFICSPHAIFTAMRGGGMPRTGHNPLGG